VRHQLLQNWTAPEVLSGEASVSPASDVYSLTNVLFEIEATRIPFTEEINSILISEKIRNGERPVFDSTQACFLSANYLQGCIMYYRGFVDFAWSQYSAQRPIASDVVLKLDEILTEFDKTTKETPT